MSQLHSWKILHHWWVNDIKIRALCRNDHSLVFRLWDSLEEYRRETRDEEMSHLWRRELYRMERYKDHPTGIRSSVHDTAVPDTISDACHVERWQISLSYARQRLAKSMLRSLNGDDIIGPQPLVEPSTILGAIPEGCPWLDLKPESLQKPKYLWDLKRHRTVDTSGLTKPLIYLAVSHTWGRWVIKGQSIKVTGVPWAVPRNSNFEVDKLTDMLKREPLRVRYIWIDLFCIPQDDSQPSFEELRRQEISLQASIFQAAACSLAWFNDIHDWQVFDTYCNGFRCDT